MYPFQPFPYQEIVCLVGVLLLLISGTISVIFHVKGWHQEIEKIIWGTEFLNLGFSDSNLKMGQWAAYCIFPFAARRAQVDKEIAKVPRKFIICIHCHLWCTLLGFALIILAIPPSVLWEDFI